MAWLRENRLYKLNKKNLSRVPNTGGNYKLYNADRQRAIGEVLTSHTDLT